MSITFFLNIIQEFLNWSELHECVLRLNPATGRPLFDLIFWLNSSNEQIALDLEKSRWQNWDNENKVKFEHFQFHDNWANIICCWRQSAMQSKAPQQASHWPSVEIVWATAAFMVKIHRSVHSVIFIFPCYLPRTNMILSLTVNFQSNLKWPYHFQVNIFILGLY